MSLGTISNFCSHLQNCSKARLGLTSVPSTRMVLALTLALQNAGFISSVSRAGPRPPQQLFATSLPHSTDADLQDPSHPDTPVVTRENVSSRRLWLGLKYWKDQPVLSHMLMESKPKKKVSLKYKQLDRVIRGRESNYVKGLTRVGECLFLLTDRGLLESREAVEKKLGGLVLCRAW